MNLRIFSSSPSPLARRRARRSVALAAALAGIGATAAVVVAQEARPGPKATFFPRVHHDAQNTGRALDEPYQGVVQGNVGANAVPRSRTGSFDVDGWGFPRNALNAGSPGTFVSKPYVYLDNSPPGLVQSNLDSPLSGSGVARPGAGWVAFNAPSVGFIGTDYHRALALDREGSPAEPDPNDPNAANEFFEWEPNLLSVGNAVGVGVPGQIVRLAISVYIPNANPTPDPTLPATQEQRITDAEYLIDCEVRGPDGGPIRVRTSQQGGGWRTLTDATGNVLYFPFRTNAPREQRRVRLSRRTSDDLTNAETTFVIADAIRFVQQFDTVATTPTLTDRHGGRRTGPRRTGDPDGGDYTPAGQQPAPTDDYQEGAFTGHDPNTNAIRVLPGDRENGFEFSTLFRGPESFIRPLRTGGAIAIPPLRPQNNNLYAAGGRATPIFSQIQVIVPRTEFVPTPATRCAASRWGPFTGWTIAPARSCGASPTEPIYRRASPWQRTRCSRAGARRADCTGCRAARTVPNEQPQRIG
jgi:hypothetical protein